MIGKKLKYLIKITKRKQIDLAKHLGISPSRLSNYLSDKREPDFEMLAEMARFLSVDLNYFADNKSFISSTRAPVGKKGVQPSYVAERPNAYTANTKSDVVYVPLTPINAKKRGINTSVIPLSKLFTSDVEDAQKDITVFEVNGYIPASIASEEDYLVCARANAVKLDNGDCLFENGRNAKFFNYYEHEGSIILINEDNKKEHVAINDSADLKDYFKILWVNSRM